MFLYFIVSWFIAVVVQSQSSRPVVRTQQGWVLGELADDGDYHSFYGIPYGGDTSGTNRFKAPTPPPQFTDEFQATQRNILCAQVNFFGEVSGVEDCLTLSIFTRNATSQVSQTVLVWLVGEDFISSNPLEHSFRRLVEENFVVVAVNYRLSVFGFLCLGTEDAPGNAGLKDVMQALEWIQKNIAEFGGDPSNVVLIGHGAGAAIADFITMSSSSIGLVHKAVAISGSALAPWAITRYPRTHAFEFSRRLGYDGDDVDELANVLSTASVNDLLRIVHVLQLTLTNTVPFAPCIENLELTNSNAIISEAPVTTLATKSYNHVPYMYSYLDWEGTVKVNHAFGTQWLNNMNTDFSNYIPVDLQLPIDAQDEVRNFYFENRTISWDIIEEVLDYHGDTWIVQPMIWGANNRAQTSDANLYLMEFQYIGTNTTWPYSQIPINGAAHGRFLNYILAFDLVLPTDKDASDEMIKRLVAFADVGNPAVNGSVNWNPLTSTRQNYIVYFGGKAEAEGVYGFGAQMGVSTPPQYRNISGLWVPLYEKYYEIPTKELILHSSAARMISVGALVLVCLFLSLY